MKKIYFLLLGVASLSACKKDSEPAPADNSPTGLLLAKNWRVTAQNLTVTSSVLNTNVDMYATYYSNACQRDNFIKFNADKTLTADEGAMKCNTTDPQTKAGTWSFSSNDTKLNLVDPTQGGAPIPFDIITLSATTLHIRYTIVTNGGIPVTNVNDITMTAF
jgi:hypothetical protein